jgi:hypothetical protein
MFLFQQKACHNALKTPSGLWEAQVRPAWHRAAGFSKALTVTAVSVRDPRGITVRAADGPIEDGCGAVMVPKLWDALMWTWPTDLSA